MIQRDAVTRQLLEDIRQRCLEGSSPTWEIGALRDHHASTSSMHELLAMLAELMQSLQQRGEYYAARTLLDAISHTLHEYLQAHERLELLLLQAALARDLSQTRKAGDTFAQVIVAAEALEYHELAARAHLGMCLMNESQVDPGRGMYHARQAYRMARRYNLTGWRDVAMNQILQYRRLQGREDSAGRLAGRQLHLLQQMVPVPVALVACVLNTMCLVLMKQNRLREAAACALEALGLNRGCGRDRAVIQCMCNLADCYIRMSDTSRALGLVEEAVEMSAALRLGYELACLASRVSQLCEGDTDRERCSRVEARIDKLQHELEMYLSEASVHESVFH